MIKKLKLSEKQVLKIVLEWYTKGMYCDLLQNEKGQDLEEIIFEELRLKNQIKNQLEKWKTKK